MGIVVGIPSAWSAATAGAAWAGWIEVRAGGFLWREQVHEGRSDVGRGVTLFQQAIDQIVLAAEITFFESFLEFVEEQVAAFFFHFFE